MTFSNYFYYMKKFLILILLFPLFAMGQAPTNDSTKKTAPPVINSFTPSSWFMRGGNASNAELGFLNTITGKWYYPVSGYQFNHYTGTSTQVLLNLKLNISDTAAMLSSYQHKVTNGFILNNTTNTPQSARISLSDSIKTTGVVLSSMINTDSTKYNMPWMGGGVILPGISEIKQSIIVPGRLGFYASAIGTTLSEKASLRNGGGMLAINGRYNDGPAFMVADSDYVSHALSTYYFAGSKGKGFLGFLHQNSTYTLTITPSNGIRTALQYDSIGNVGIMQRTGVFTAFGKAAYNEAQPLTALSFLYKGRTDSLYAPISGSVNYIQNNLTNTPQSARISVSDSVKTTGVVKSGAILSVTTNTNSLDVSSNSFVWDNPSILTQFANSQTSYSGVYNSFVTYGYNQFGSGNATLKVVPSQYVLQSFARDTSFSNRYQALLVSGTNIKTVNSNSLIGSGNIAVGDALVANPLSQFASTTSAQLRSVLSDETGNGLAYFQNGDLGTPSAGVGTNLTGTALGLTAGNVTTNANLTGVITSVGNATSIASQTGTGSKFVVDTSPTLITPTSDYLTITGSIGSAATPTGANIVMGRAVGANIFAFKGANGFVATISSNGLTTTRNFMLPDVAGTFATINGGQTFTSAIWNATKIAEIYGGTNQSTYTTGDLLYASASNTLSKLGIGSTGNILTVSGGIPTWGTLANLTATDGTLTFSGTYNGTTARTIGINQGNAFTWSGTNDFSNVVSTSFNSGAGITLSNYTSTSGKTVWGNNYTAGGGETDLFTGIGSAGTVGGLNIYNFTNAGTATLLSQLNGTTGALGIKGNVYQLSTGATLGTAGNPWGAVYTSAAAYSSGGYLIGVINTGTNKLETVTQSQLSSTLIVGTPTIAAGTGAGTSPAISVTSNGKQLQVTLTVGTLPVGANAAIGTITLANALSYTPYPGLFGANATASLLSGATMVYATSSGTSTITINSGTTALPTGTYIWNITL